MSLNKHAFDYVAPTPAKLELMAHLNLEFARLAREIEDNIRPCDDRAHVIRLIRDAAMWADTAILRDSDGAPR